MRSDNYLNYKIYGESIMKYVAEHVSKFNQRVVMMLTFLLQKCPQNRNLNDTAVLISGAVTLRPNTEDVLDKFVSAFKNCMDYLLTRNKDIINKMDESILKKEDLVEIAQSLSEENQKIAWDFIESIYKRAVKACPALKEQDFDFDALNTNIKNITDVVVKEKRRSKSSKPTKTGLVTSAFRNACVDLITIVKDQHVGNAAVIHKSETMLGSLESISLEQLMDAFKLTFPEEYSADLVGST